MRALAALALLVPLSIGASFAETGRSVTHGVVYYEEGRYAGWPANNGIWSWGDEIVVGFMLGYYKDNPGGHPIDPALPSVPRQARSLGGGQTWTIETPSYLDAKGTQRKPIALERAADFSNPDFAARFRNGRFYISDDRCRTWQGPFLLPTFGRKGLLARTDYIVNDKHDLMAFIATEKDEGGEGWPCCIRTTDGGKTWRLVGWIGEQPPAGYGYAIMPSTVRLASGALLTMIRRGAVVDEAKRWWLEAFISPDEGEHWYMLDKPRIDNKGNPASMIVLRDGRIALTYGYRGAPYGIRARISSDLGVSWGEEIILRGDGGGWDLGYPRTVQRPDGKCVTVYYFNDGTRKERYIAVTIWDPGE